MNIVLTLYQPYVITFFHFLQAHIVNLDTFGKLRRKEQMETQLKGLEADIEKLEKTPVLIRP